MKLVGEDDSKESDLQSFVKNEKYRSDQIFIGIQELNDLSIGISGKKYEQIKVR